MRNGGSESFNPVPEDTAPDIASNQGSESAAPAPRRSVRREIGLNIEGFYDPIIFSGDFSGPGSALNLCCFADGGSVPFRRGGALEARSIREFLTIGSVRIVGEIVTEFLIFDPFTT